ncbi:L-ascorbate metabolism protein UlaG, beta-lactamase superfamily [Daejeonella rubra]|uniref:L-ascorbate metabolism protein UlaG, beta-lactamase superfamily n=1 Tax=Daejeonella rubra TaxID=990371 RepID=A0A1G9R0B2_9SPHI|nr:MBL fold metallo-hydrolase [Daejeonella rubra]SDM15905.1 L-ascorbate metabolism protein UlaG, beta-lactamase superfamily [Daejeonella rubra]
MFRILGRNPSGEDLLLFNGSSNYRKGAFQNESFTDLRLKDASFFKMMRLLINKPKTVNPSFSLPSVKTDLRLLDSEGPLIIWFGHSSYLIRYMGMTILVDPVLSGRVSPVSFFGNSFPGTDIYSPEDFPDIDLMILTHDHYDHLDYKTISAFSAKTRHFYVPLGLDAHLKFWGIDSAKITSMDWWQTVTTAGGFQLTSTPARHFTGRSLKRNQTLWTSFVLKMGAVSIFIGGDSGYDTHFKTIGDKFGPFNIAILESGQYNDMWPYIHLRPEESVRAAIELQADLLLPVHWGKFALAFHDWDEPVKRVLSEAAEQKLSVTTPMIGEPIFLGSVHPDKEWWSL